jgi:hypothetical protein
MAYADIPDVEVSLGRPLTSDESNRAFALLDRAEARIQSRMDDLAALVAADPVLLATVVEVEADAVARVLRNPEGLLQEQDGDYMYIRSRELPSGLLELTEAEWTRLGVGSQAFTITPYGDDTERTWVAPDVWI